MAVLSRTPTTCFEFTLSFGLFTHYPEMLLVASHAVDGLPLMLPQRPSETSLGYE